MWCCLVLFGVHIVGIMMPVLVAVVAVVCWCRLVCVLLVLLFGGGCCGLLLLGVVWSCAMVAVDCSYLLCVSVGCCSRRVISNFLVPPVAQENSSCATGAQDNVNNPLPKGRRSLCHRWHTETNLAPPVHKRT